jgi:predicted glycosyltransferase
MAMATGRPIGYYVHHQGNGHLQRALSIAASSEGRIVLLGTGLAGRAGNFEYVELPDDRTNADFGGLDGALSRPRALHYAPLHHATIRDRMALIANWIAVAKPALFVVDVSVEVAMLVRLCSTPVVYVRLSGRRDDDAHLEAFRLAEALLAPFDARLDDPHVAPWVRAKTIFCSGIGTTCTLAGEPDVRTILVVKGKGGVAADGNDLAAAARLLPDRKWRVIGPCTDPECRPMNLEILGWVDNPMVHIVEAGVVVGAAGDGLVTQVLAAARPFICIPEDRPYDEQRLKAAALKRLDAAVVLNGWPSAHEWPTLLASAEEIPFRKSKQLVRENGGAEAYRALRELAGP